MLNLDVIYDFTIAIKWDEFIQLLPCQVSIKSLHSTSVRGLKNSVLKVSGGKAMATDHRVNPLLNT